MTLQKITNSIKNSIKNNKNYQKLLELILAKFIQEYKTKQEEYDETINTLQQDGLI